MSRETVNTHTCVCATMANCSVLSVHNLSPERVIICTGFQGISLISVRDEYFESLRWLLRHNRCRAGSNPFSSGGHGFADANAESSDSWAT